MTQTTSTTRDQINRTNAAFVEAFKRGDSAGWVAVYTAEGQILPLNAEPKQGKPAIQAFWQSVIEMGVAAVDLETVEFEAQGDTGWEVGKFALKAQDGSVLDAGKYIVVWKQANGQWQWHRDIWNSSQPASA
jgi:ketosteroid isomerase-like protein